jgi:hypothetical protein
MPFVTLADIESCLLHRQRSQANAPASDIEGLSQRVWSAFNSPTLTHDAMEVLELFKGDVNYHGLASHQIDAVLEVLGQRGGDWRQFFLACIVTYATIRPVSQAGR